MIVHVLTEIKTSLFQLFVFSLGCVCVRAVTVGHTFFWLVQGELAKLECSQWFKKMF